MPPQIASLVFALCVFGLFMLDRDREVQTSKALWIPGIWLSLAGSRAVAEWLSALGWAAPISEADAYLAGSPADRIVLTALLVLGLIVLVSRGAQVGRLLRANGPILLFFFYGSVSAFWSDYPDITFKRWLKDVGDLVMVMVVLTDRDWYSAIKRVLVQTGFILVPLSILFIKYYPEIGRTYNRWTWEMTVTGVTTHKNLLGQVCLMFGIAFVWCFLAAYRDRQGPHRTRHLIAHGAALAMVVWLFVMANSVTAQSCFLLATVLLLATGSRASAQTQRLMHLLVAVLVLVPFATLFLGVGGDVLEGMGRDSTFTGRTEIWQQVLAVAGHPLVGTGFESFWLGRRLEILQGPHLGLNEAHNGYLEIYLNLGWIGVTLLSVLIVTGYRNIISSFRQNPDVARLRMAYLIAAVVTSFTEAGFRMGSLTWITFLMAITVVPEADPEGPPQLGIDPTYDLAESEPQVDHALGVGGW